MSVALGTRTLPLSARTLILTLALTSLRGLGSDDDADDDDADARGGLPVEEDKRDVSAPEDGMVTDKAEDINL